MNNITHHSSFSREAGQTLIEVVSGIGLLVIVVTALIGLGVVAMKTSSSARNRTVGVKLANQGMEMARSMRDENDLDAVNSMNLPDDTVTVGSVAFTRTWNISEVVAGQKKKIVVEVSWPESSGTKSIGVTSYLTDWR